MDFKARKSWKKVTLNKEENLGIIFLDDKELKSPRGNKLSLPYSLSKKVFNEWNEVQEEIKPSLMPFYSYSVTAVDRIMNQKNDVFETLRNILSMDMILYRSGNNSDLSKLQEKEWQPLVKWLDVKFNCKLTINYELKPLKQKESELLKCTNLIKELDHFSLSGFSHLVSISGSFILGLSFYFKKISSKKLYELALIEELFQSNKWGSDDFANERRANIKKEITEACEFLDTQPRII
jgi:chaperone required for assembly of F1-ATPase